MSRSGSHPDAHVSTRAAAGWALVFAGLIPAAVFGAENIPSWVTVVLPSGASVGLEVVADDDSRARGLMFRHDIEKDQGMLFWYPTPGRYSFWMKNCHVPLDIVWFDASWRVVHVESEAEPCPTSGPCPSIAPPVEARYVIEFASGVAAQNGLVRGESVVVLTEKPIP